MWPNINLLIGIIEDGSDDNFGTKGHQGATSWPQIENTCVFVFKALKSCLYIWLNSKP